MSIMQLPLHLRQRVETTGDDDPAEDRLSLALIEALTRVWSRIRAYHPQVPAVVLLPAPARRRHPNVLGHFSAQRWSGEPTGKAARHEVVVVAEHLNRPAEDIVETLLHEAAHAANCEAGIHDCSASQYHNRAYKGAAENLGLLVERMPNYGFALTSLPPSTARAYEAEIAELHAVLIHRHSALSGTSGPPPPPGAGDNDDDRPRSRSLRATCACPFIIRVSQSTISSTVIRCECCGEPFRLT